jgi:hypothetical protein
MIATQRVSGVGVHSGRVVLDPLRDPYRPGCWIWTNDKDELEYGTASETGSTGGAIG